MIENKTVLKFRDSYLVTESLASTRRSFLAIQKSNDK